LRKIVVAALVVASALLGMAVPAVAAASEAKIVIVVGADTPQYLDDANELYAEAIQHTSNVIRVYSPNATWSAVKNAAAGANVLIYLGHGNGWPNPYSSSPNGYTTKDGFGLNASAAGTHYNLTYYGEPYIKELDLAPGAIVFLHHLCYASGNSEPGKTPPTLSVAMQRVDNYGSAFLAAGASAVVADGHSHSSYYLRSLFTEPQSLGAFWRNAPNYHGHDIAFTPTRSTGTAVMDPDNGGSSPSGFYRSIVGDLDVWTQDVIGLKLPPGVRGDPGVTIVPEREPGGEPAQSPEDAAAEAAGPQPLVLFRTTSVHIRRLSVPSR
jgi:hypothetical protein